METNSLGNNLPSIKFTSMQKYSPSDNIPTVEQIKEDTCKSLFESFFRETKFDGTDLNALMLAERAVANGLSYEDMTKSFARVDIIMGGDHILIPKKYERENDAEIIIMVTADFHNPAYTLNERKLNDVINAMTTIYSPRSIQAERIDKGYTKVDMGSAYPTGPLQQYLDSFKDSTGNLRSYAEQLTTPQFLQELQSVLKDIVHQDVLPNDDTLKLVVHTSYAAMSHDVVLNAVATHQDVKTHSERLEKDYPSMAMYVEPISVEPNNDEPAPSPGLSR